MKNTKSIAVITLCFVVLSVFAGVASVSAQAKIFPSPGATGKFVLWTNDGKHKLEGTYKQLPVICNSKSNYSNTCVLGTFEGKDEKGQSVKGIFTKNIFKGAYENGKAFSGTYTRNSISGINGASGKWTARGLFGLKQSSGKYQLFPQAPITIMNAA